ncbi:MAG: hypothetical protein V3T60_16935 [Candidatus Binatia bacterium]
MKTGAINALQPTTGTFDGAPHIQTPSRVEYGPGGRFRFGKSLARIPTPLSKKAAMGTQTDKGAKGHALRG